MGARRLDRPLGPGAVVRRPVTLRWDGREIDAREGEPLAVSLLANDVATISRSFRFHRPRGLMCATGSCGWCECEVDGLPSVRSCRVPAREGLVARSEHARPSAAFDLLGVLDRANRLVTPGFYHHRFLRPARFRKAYLDVIRWFGGRGRVHPGPRPPREWGEGREGGDEHVLAADVAVVGGGPAGLTAALAALGAGARVIVVEAEPEAGGTARWSTTDGGPGGSGSRALVAEAIDRLGADLLVGATAVARDDDILRIVGPTGPVAVRAPIVIGATGSYERPPFVPGGDRPGVIGSRAVEMLLCRWAVLPGERAALVGDDASTAGAARLLEAAGATIAARIPDEALTRIDGRDRVRRVRWIDGGRQRSTAVDLVVVGRRVPSLELPTLAGARLTWRTGALAPDLDDAGRTSVAWLYVVGSATGLGRDADRSPRQAEATGRSAAEAARPGVAAFAPGTLRGVTPVSAAPASVTAEPGGNAAAPDEDAHVCFCEDVRVHDIRRERAAGYDDPESLKRRTGALTGPCQGKYCLDRFLGLCGVGPGAPGGEAPGGEASARSSGSFLLPTTRPPLRPIRLAELAGPKDRA